MTINQKQIAMLEFNLAVYKKAGQEFEDYFVDIMKHHDANFLPVKAYGNIGDQKNDGYNRCTGEYYQVYAPADIEKEKSISDAVKKLDEDFNGLLKHWDESCPILAYNFVINDKFKGVSPIIHKAINELDKNHPEIQIKLFLSHDLQEVFRALSEEQIYDFIRYIPDEEISLEYTALNHIVNYIKGKYTFLKGYKADLIAPDFYEKITFNELSPLVSNYLQIANYQTGCLDTYFKADNKYLRKEFQDLFKGLYEESKLKVPKDTVDYADTRFFYILDCVAPDSSKSTISAVLVLMSFYFESCDIFEPPTKDEV